MLARPQPTNEVVVYVERLDAATQEALWYARTISRRRLPGDPRSAPRTATPASGRASSASSQGSRTSRSSLRRTIPLDALLEYIWAFPHGEGDFVTVVIPELFRKPSLAAPAAPLDLLAQAAARCASRVSSSRTCLGCGPIDGIEPLTCRLRRSRLGESTRSRSARSCYAQNAPSRARRGGLPLVQGRPTRERTAAMEPLRTRHSPRDHRRALPRPRRPAAPSTSAGVTADPETVAVVVMPELVVRGTDRLLHNQRALYLKRLLLFEPRVILASVPYQLL